MYSLARFFLFHKYMKRLRTIYLSTSNHGSKDRYCILVYRCLEYERKNKKIPKMEEILQFDRMEFKNKS